MRHNSQVKNPWLKGFQMPNVSNSGRLLCPYDTNSRLQAPSRYVLRKSGPGKSLLPTLCLYREPKRPQLALATRVGFPGVKVRERRKYGMQDWEGPTMRLTVYCLQYVPGTEPDDLYTLNNLAPGQPWDRGILLSSLHKFRWAWRWAFVPTVPVRVLSLITQVSLKLSPSHTGLLGTVSSPTPPQPFTVCDIFVVF